MSLSKVSVQVAGLGRRPGSPRLAPDRAVVTRMTRHVPPAPWAWRIWGQVEAQPAEDGGGRGRAQDYWQRMYSQDRSGPSQPAGREVGRVGKP